MTATTQTQTLPVVGPHYKWLVLSNTTVGVLLATLNSTSLLSALPVAFGRQRSTDRLSGADRESRVGVGRLGSALGGSNCSTMRGWV